MSYSRNWFTPTNFETFLHHFKNTANVNFLEIGSFEGQGTNYFVDNFLTGTNSNITCVDPWIKYSDATISNLNYWDDVMNEETYNVFLNNTKHNKEKIIIYKGFSIDIIPKLTETFDFIYIDDDHSTEAVLKDAILSFEKLKINGILIFDDYLWNCDNQSPKIAIDKFIQDYSDKINILLINYQAIIKKLRIKYKLKIFNLYILSFKHFNPYI